MLLRTLQACLKPCNKICPALVYSVEIGQALGVQPQAAGMICLTDTLFFTAGR